ncbi:restin homolog isoform X2 [Selaginella moellendorffii]|uniref:restin homolog isoform X2 n=1 Tax=Selaginella moellendorffii TaxID=88036 RepID=UPI000D1C7463|nr:restin homolog isoform X2 [Selaginella moellendorffii]|eukprot:XP_024534424.1 restin homolog isoform X2 [Selaginella moellendorffii]
MDGLLAWAADVVGGGSDPESPAARAFLAFTPDQLHEIERLDRRASELQRSLQQLRHRLPPANIAQGLPHLHAESLASQSALALELHAHSASRIQAQVRESTLQSDIAAYKKALAATEQQAVDRSREAQELESSFQELDQLEQKLREEYDCLEKELRAQRDSIEELEEKVQEASPLEEEEASELQSLRAELAKWQTKAAESRKELSMVENEALAWPSSAQREKDLERRLRSLTEQLTAKQAQAEKLTIERDNLEARVEHANQARKNQLVESLAHTVKRNKIGVKHLLMDPSEPQRKYPSRGGLSSSLGVFRTSLAFKALVVGYVFLLHVIVLVVLSSKHIED